MKRGSLSLLVVIVIASVTLTVAQTQPQDAEAKIRKSAVPKPVLMAFEKMYPAATVKGYAKETEKGQTSYEVECVEGKTHRDVSFAPDGKLLLIEESVEPAAIPAATQQAFDKKYPKAKVSMVEKVVGEGREFYEFHFTSAAGKKGEAKFDFAGKEVKG